MIFAALILASRVVVIVALAYASDRRADPLGRAEPRITPFGAWPRFMRRASDPVLLPLERRIVRSGGSPQDAPLWLVGIVIVGGLLLLSLVQWLAGSAVSVEILAQSGPRAWGRFLVSVLFTVVWSRCSCG
jgi:hypothetical protein